jgi:hypothetical protein
MSVSRKRDALFAAVAVFNYDGTATMMTDVVSAPATSTHTVEATTSPGKQIPLFQVDTLLSDCTENKNFKALVSVMPKLGSVSGATQEVVAQYPPTSPLAACNGLKHRQLMIFYSAPDTGSDTLTIHARIGGEVVDLVYVIKSN